MHDKRTSNDSSSDIKQSIKKAVLVLIPVFLIFEMFMTFMSGVSICTVSGDSMYPSFLDGDTVWVLNTSNIDCGDCIVFTYEEMTVLKRVIAKGGDVISIDDSGQVTVNGNVIEENYLEKPAYGLCDITYPYTVPEDTFFVMGDNRGTSIDSRTKQIGTIAADNVKGKIIFK